VKFKNIKTIEHILKEYSYSSSGEPKKSGEQKHGSIAKQTPKQPLATKKTFSPTLDGPKAQEPEQAPQPKMVKARDIVTDPQNDKQPKMVQYKNKKSLEVISPVDTGKNPDALVVKDIESDKIFAIDKDESVTEIPEGKLANRARAQGKKLKVKSLKGRIKKLSRKKLKEANKELFEINFNRKEI
jgi:hypothetical protein